VATITHSSLIFTCYCTQSVFSGVQRSGDARGDCLIVCPLPNSSIEQWRMVVIVNGCTLFVTSQFDDVFTFANKRTARGPHAATLSFSCGPRQLYRDACRKCCNSMFFRQLIVVPEFLPNYNELKIQWIFAARGKFMLSNLALRASELCRPVLHALYLLVVVQCANVMNINYISAPS